MKQNNIKKSIVGKIASIGIGIAMFVTGVAPVLASGGEVPITQVSFPTKVSVKVGETKTLAVKVSPANTTYKTSIEWQMQSKDSFTCKTNGFGTFWNQASSEDITGVAAGEGSLFTTVNVYDSTGKYIKKYKISTSVTVIKKQQSVSNEYNNNSANSNTKAKKKNNTGKYLNVSKVYTQLNKFRTSKKVWQWNRGNKSKKYFNTNSKNKLKKLKKSSALMKTAKLRAKELATVFSHTRPNGKDYSSAYPGKYTCVGENIAYGYNSAASVMNGWKESEEKYAGQGHRRAMLNKQFKSVGIACYQKNGIKYWVQCFGN